MRWWSGAALTVILAFFVLLAVATRRSVRLYLERQRVAREYLSGAKITPPPIGIVHQMEGGTRAEFATGALVSAGVTLAAAGVGTLVHAPNTGWAIGLIALGKWCGVVGSSAILSVKVPSTLRPGRPI